MTNQLHSYATQGSSEVLFLRFAPDLVGHFYHACKGKVPVCNKFICEHMDFIEQVPADFDNLYLVKGILYGLCGCFSSQAEFVEVPDSSSDALIYHIINYIEDHYTGECSLKNVSQELGYEYSYLSKYFSRYTGISFVEYVNRSRLTLACHMLRNTEQSFLDIAQSCGFGSLRSFNRNFKNCYGCTPSQYKEDVICCGL